MSDETTRDPVTGEERPAAGPPFHAAVIGRLLEESKAMIDETPEIRSVSVAIDWRVPGASGLPVGFSLGRQGEVRHPDEVMGAMDATRRLLVSQFAVLGELFNKVQSFASSLAARVNKIESLVKDLEARKAALWAEVTDLEDRKKSGGGG